MNSSDLKNAELSPEFPLADVRESMNAGTILTSKMWWVTLSCAIVAFVLAWQAVPNAGPVITIEFPQGHGLKAGDSLRHRGIDVGIVQTASLRSDLSGIQVVVELKPEAEVLCRQESRFWIVRPRVGLTGIKGLDTVVGARYIAVSPGPAGAVTQQSFQGLIASPPDEFSGDGLELMLRAEVRNGLNPGAPVTWRGVQVGQVLSVSLSPDANHVNASVRIGSGYRQLVTSGSKFWVTSGIGVHVGLSGIDLSADSLASLVLGGISFITPETNEPATEVRNGHVFMLHQSVDESWLQNTASIPLINVDLPKTVAIEGSISKSFLGIKRQRTFSVTGTLLRFDSAVSMLTGNLPSEVQAASGELVTDLRVRLPESDEWINIAFVDVREDGEQNDGVLLIAYPDDDASDVPRNTDVLRVAVVPEECCAVRTLFSGGQMSSAVHAFSVGDFSVRDRIWMVTDTDQTDLSAWNGAPVISLSDGKIIGVMQATNQSTAVMSIPESIVK
ncbi:MAG: MlaD family protein [Fuerstiella sp.]|nr:MlaD family protein [Fuerstiella sp.]